MAVMAVFFAVFGGICAGTLTWTEADFNNQMVAALELGTVLYLDLIPGGANIQTRVRGVPVTVTVIITADDAGFVLLNVQRITSGRLRLPPGTASYVNRTLVPQVNTALNRQFFLERLVVEQVAVTNTDITINYTWPDCPAFLRWLDSY